MISLRRQLIVLSCGLNDRQLGDYEMMLSVPLPTDREFHTCAATAPSVADRRTVASGTANECLGARPDVRYQRQDFGLRLVFLQERLNAVLQLGIKLVVVHRKLHAPRPLDLISSVLIFGNQ